MNKFVISGIVFIIASALFSSTLSDADIGDSANEDEDGDEESDLSEILSTFICYSLEL